MFFYQNEFGSRVYFDDVGGDWPKHPCTDNSYLMQSFPGLSPQPVKRREPKETENIDRALDNMKYHGGFFRRPVQDTTNEIYEVIACRRKGFCNFIAAITIKTIPDEAFYLAFDSAKFTPLVGAFFNFDGNICRFLDIKTSSPVKFKTRSIDKKEFRAAGPSIVTK